VDEGKWDYLAAMLTSKDYRRDNWEHVTWQIISGIYAKGYVESCALPPEDFLEWMMKRHGLHSTESIRIVNVEGTKGKMVWRITIRQANEQKLET
jgi:hypothetical protein